MTPPGTESPEFTNTLIGNNSQVTLVTMSMGAYDEEEHERREAKAASVEVDSDDERTEYRGSVSFDSGDSTEALLDQFKEIKSGR